MSEKTKQRFEQNVIVWTVDGSNENVKALAGCISGRITNKGVTLADRGETKVANLVLSVRNATKVVKFALKKLGLKEDAITVQESNGNEYVSIRVSVWGKNAENIEKYAKAGDTIRLCGNVTATEYEGKSYLNFSAVSWDKVFTGAKGATTDAKEADAEAVPANSEPVTEQPSDVSVDENFDDFDDIGEGDLPW